MSADLDALDRGLVDVGVTAAEALARIEELEQRVAEMEKFFAILRDSRPAAKRPARKRAARPGERHLTAVRPS